MQTSLLKSRFVIYRHIKRAALIMSFLLFRLFFCDLHCIHAAKECHFITSLPFLLLFVESDLAIRIIIIYLQGNVNASQVPLGGREISLVLFTYPPWIHQMASNRTIWSPCLRLKQQNWWWNLNRNSSDFFCLFVWGCGLSIILILKQARKQNILLCTWTPSVLSKPFWILPFVSNFVCSPNSCFSAEDDLLGLAWRSWVGQQRGGDGKWDIAAVLFKASSVWTQ